MGLGGGGEAEAGLELGVGGVEGEGLGEVEGSGGEVAFGEEAGAEEAGEAGAEVEGGDGDFWGVGALGEVFEPGSGVGEALGGDFGEGAVEGVGGEGLEEVLVALGGAEGWLGALGLLEDPDVSDEGAEEGREGVGRGGETWGEEGVEEAGGFGEVAGLGEGDAEFGADVEVASGVSGGGGVGPLCLEKWEIASDLRGHGFAGVAGVEEGDVEGLEGGPGAALALEPGVGVFVDASFEVEIAAMAEEAGGWPGGVVGARAVLEGGGGGGGVEEAEEATEFTGGEDVVGVEEEDPVFGDVGDAGVASGGEVVDPGEVAEVGAVLGGEGEGSVVGAGVGEVDGGEAFEAAEAGVEGIGGVFGDEADGEGRAHGRAGRVRYLGSRLRAPSGAVNSETVAAKRGAA